MDKQILESLLEKLNAAHNTGVVSSSPVVIGFDAFVDQIMTLVEERQSAGQYKSMASISEFGAWVGQSAGKSGGLEAVTLEKAMGGCAINQADGMSTFGLPVHLFATSAKDSTFEPLHQKVASHTDLGISPGNALVYEFEDGKLLFCETNQFSRVNSSFFQDFAAKSGFLEKCQQATALVFTSWSVFPFMTDCYEVLLEKVLNQLTHRPYVFIDLADPASRSKTDMLELLNVLPKFEKYTRFVFNLNGNEANQIATVLGIEKAELDDFETVVELASVLRKKLSISEVCIHLIKGAVAASETQKEWVLGAYCEKPKKSTGAGDRFNAGYVLGTLLALPMKERLMLANLSSGCFVRNAASPTLPELIEFAETHLNLEKTFSY